MISEERCSPELSSAQRAYLRSLAHPLEARIRVGKSGLSAGLSREIEAQLEGEELVKLRFERAIAGETEGLLERIAVVHGCALVQRLGRIAVLYRPRPEPVITLPS